LVIRIVHLTVGLALGLLVYLPASMSGGLKTVLMLAGLPLAVLSGVWLWQQGRIRRWLGRRPEPAEREPVGR
jgi:hypothetical protein